MAAPVSFSRWLGLSYPTAERYRCLTHKRHHIGSDVEPHVNSMVPIVILKLAEDHAAFFPWKLQPLRLVVLLFPALPPDAHPGATDGPRSFENRLDILPAPFFKAVAVEP